MVSFPASGLELAMDEKTAFEQLKNEIVGEFGEDVIDDDGIRRFLRARENDVNQARLMIIKNLEWRRKNKVDTILRDYAVPELFAKYFVFGMIGFDKVESLVFIASVGKLDYKGILKAAKQQELVQYFTYYIELCQHKMRERSRELEGKPVDQCTMILDFENYSFSHATSKPTIDRNIVAAQMSEANYPEMLKVVYAINVSVYFTLIYNIVKPFVPAKTLKKLKVFGKHGWKEELSKIIDPQILPAYLGGERTDPDGNPMCYSIISHGGVIPERLYMKNRAESHFRQQPGVKYHFLRRRSQFNVPLNVKIAGSAIEWSIETDNYEIGLGLFFRESQTTPDEQLIPILPLQTVDAHITCQTDRFLCKKRGTYILTLDNSFSFIRSKHVYYKVSVIDPDEMETDDVD